MYGHLLREISCAELLIHGSTNDKIDMQHRHSVVKYVSKLIDSGSPLLPIGGHTVVALHLTITSNCTDLLPLLLSSGVPLTTTTSGMSVLQLSWLCPDVTTHIAVIVTRVMKTLKISLCAYIGIVVLIYIFSIEYLEIHKCLISDRNSQNKGRINKYWVRGGSR